MRIDKKFFAAAALLWSIGGCGNMQRHKGSEDAEPKGRADYKIGVHKVDFDLTAATAYTIAVDGCTSGYTSTINEFAKSLYVYQYDQNCLAKLTTLSVNGISYTPSVDDPFDTWLAGDTATFVNSDNASEKLVVQVLAQLDNPIPDTAPTHGVEYLYKTILAGDDKTCSDDCIQNSYTVSVEGAAVPEFDVKVFSYIGMSNMGAGKFHFQMECSNDIEGSGDTATCLGSRLLGLRYLLVEDTYGDRLTLEQADLLFSSNIPLSVDPSEVVPVADADMPHGGFVTKGGADALTGPNRLHEHPNMILILQQNNLSYKFWNVDVTPIVQ